MSAHMPTVDTLMDTKVSRFSGRDEDWNDRCLRLEACGALLEYGKQTDSMLFMPNEVRMPEKHGTASNQKQAIKHS